MPEPASDLAMWRSHELLVRITKQLAVLDRKVDKLMSDQSHLDTDIQAIGTQFATVVAELKAQHAAGTPLDFTAADALVATVTGEAAADAPATDAPPADAPPADTPPDPDPNAPA